MMGLLEKTVGELVVERPGRARVFEGFGIDYCCGGQKPLKEACRKKGLDPEMVQNVLGAFDEAARGGGERDWGTARLSDLADHIEGVHHAYLKRELPRLAGWIAKVSAKYGEHDARLGKLMEVFSAYEAELVNHMAKEEQVLFPLVRALEAGSVSEAHCGSVNNPIRVMMQEHDDAGTALKRMSALTDEFTPPAQACNTYRALLEGLAELQRDMYQHVHKENNILFPRAAELERLVGV